METSNTELEPREASARQAYERPAVVYEVELEVRAGSPVGIDPLGLAGLNQ